MRRRPAVVLGLVVASLLSLTSPAAASDPTVQKHRVDSAITGLNKDLDETSTALRAAGAALDTAEAKLPAAQAKVAEVHGRLLAAQERDRLLGQQLAGAKAEVSRAQGQIKATMATIANNKKLVGRIARSSYQANGLGELAVVLDSQSPSQFASRLVLVQSALRSEGNILGGLSDSRANLAALRTTLVAKRQAVADMKHRQEHVVAEVTDLQNQAVGAQQDVESLISARASAVQSVEAQKAEQERQIATMRAESARLGRLLAARARAARIAAARAAAAGRSINSSGSGALAFPVSAPITSPYGMRVHPITGIYKLHDGTDFGVGCGTPVHAAASGTVIQTADVPGYGNQMVIDHGVMRGVGVATSYNHMSSFSVGYGTHVNTGDLIGYSGGGEGMSGAGYSTGCHLHFMVYVNGGTTDPMGWL